MHTLTLLCGMPRSGTTWIGKIFDSHPDTLYRHEPDSGRALKAVPSIAPISDAEKYQDVLRRFVTQLPQLNTARSAGSFPLFPKRYYWPGSLFFKTCSVLMAKASEIVHHPVPIFDFVDYRNVANLHVVWKSIESPGRIGAIVRAIPECHAIMILRHPCGYIASVLNGEQRNHFTAGTKSSDDFPIFEMLLRRSPHKHRNPSLNELKKLSVVERLAWRWVLYNEIALTDIQPFARCATIRYEDLCSNPLIEARKLLGFVGLDWHPQVEGFIHRSTTRSSRRYYSIYKNPEDASVKWQDQLTRARIDRIMDVLSRSELVEMYGTERMPPSRRIVGDASLPPGSHIKIDNFSSTGASIPKSV